MTSGVCVIMSIGPVINKQLLVSGWPAGVMQLEQEWRMSRRANRKRVRFGLLTARYRGQNATLVLSRANFLPTSFSFAPTWSHSTRPYWQLLEISPSYYIIPSVHVSVAANGVFVGRERRVQTVRTAKWTDCVSTTESWWVLCRPVLLWAAQKHINTGVGVGGGGGGGGVGVGCVV